MSQEEMTAKLAAFDHFTWNGAVHIDEEYPNNTLPVWTVHNADGTCWQYFYTPWVSGNDALWWEGTRKEEMPRYE